MKTTLKLLFLAILAAMLWVTVTASFDRNVLIAGKELWLDPWGKATLFDAYCGFTTFFVWVAYKENSWPRGILWFALIMILGNIAMSLYMLIQLFKLKDGESFETLLLRKKA